MKNVIEWEIFEMFLFKDVLIYKFVGKLVFWVDLKDKVIGVFMFGMDVSLFDMLYGVVVCLECIGVIFVGVDMSVVEKILGVVKVVKELDFVGVVVIF